MDDADSAGKKFELVCLNCKRSNIMILLDGGESKDFIDWDDPEVNG